MRKNNQWVVVETEYCVLDYPMNMPIPTIGSYLYIVGVGSCIVNEVKYSVMRLGKYPMWEVRIITQPANRNQ